MLVKVLYVLLILPPETQRRYLFSMQVCSATQPVAGWMNFYIKPTKLDLGEKTCMRFLGGTPLTATIKC